MVSLPSRGEPPPSLMDIAAFPSCGDKETDALNWRLQLLNACGSAHTSRGYSPRARVYVYAYEYVRGEIGYRRALFRDKEKLEMNLYLNQRETFTDRSRRAEFADSYREKYREDRDGLSQFHFNKSSKWISLAEAEMKSMSYEDLGLTAMEYYSFSYRWNFYDFSARYLERHRPSLNRSDFGCESPGIL